MGINLKENSGQYILVPGAMFFEFIPIHENNLEEGDNISKVLFIDQLEIDESYEIVITNFSGLYRYRMGDVIKIIGYHNASPIIEFQYRKVRKYTIISTI